MEPDTPPPPPSGAHVATPPPPVPAECLAAPVAGRLAGEHHAWLRRRGTLLIGSGTLALADTAISFHSDYGPLGQDKPTNQDYALVWQGERDGRPVVGIAIGDGLTSSQFSEQGSEAACSAALHTLVAEMNADAPRRAFESAVVAAVQATKLLAGELSLNPEKSCPPGQFPATWKFIIRQGRIFQTTLTLAWWEDSWLRVGMVGDGGCVVSAANLPEPQVVAQPDLTTMEVNALGPGESASVPLDIYYEARLRGPFLVALYTDGVGRGIGAVQASLLPALDHPALEKAGNPARAFLADAIQRDPKGFDDNLTLVVLRTPAAGRP